MASRLSSSVPPQQPLRVLLVEGDSLIIEDMAETLRVAGHEVALAMSEGSARERIGDWHELDFDMVYVNQRLGREPSVGERLLPLLAELSPRPFVFFVSVRLDEGLDRRVREFCDLTADANAVTARTLLGAVAAASRRGPRPAGAGISPGADETLALPVQGAASPGAAPPVAPVAHQPPPAVLYVDDENANLLAFSYEFNDRFRVLTAPSGREALDILAREKVSVLLSDQRMPGMSGVQLCELAREQFPDVVRMIVTAYTDVATMIAAINQGQVLHYIIKPWDDLSMSEALRAGVEAYSAGVWRRELHRELLGAKPSIAQGHYAVNRLCRAIATPVAHIASSVAAMRGVLAQPSGSAGGLADAKERLRSLATHTADLTIATEAMAQQIEELRDDAGGSPDALPTTSLVREVELVTNLLRDQGMRPKAVLEIDHDAILAVDQTKLDHLLLALIGHAHGSGTGSVPRPVDSPPVTVRTGTTNEIGWFEITDGGTPGGGWPTAPLGVPGSGLVAELVRQMRGTISSVPSSTGPGTCVRVELPLVSAR